jgi:SWI/SNF-related matrix-associated actin-dependent regulator 1 of chromatin subfamily A
MVITHRDGIFVAIATYEEKNAVKEAGFSWHLGHYQTEEGCPLGPGKCYACRVGLKRAWWTRRPEAAARLSAYADEEARRALGEHMRAVEMSRAVDSDIEIPAPRGFDYLGYQKAGISYLSKREGTLLGDEQGLGKTIQVLGLINFDRSIESVLVLCPATLRTNWKREAEKWLVSDGRRWLIHVVDEDKPIAQAANFVIVHYNRVSVTYKACNGPCKGIKREPLPCPVCKGTGNGARHPLLCSHCKGRKHVFCGTCKGKGKLPSGNLKVIESLMKRTWDLIAVDEAHYLKNLNARRTKAVLGDPFKKKTDPSKNGLADLAKRKVFMTGTPIPNKPIEIWPIVSTLAPKEFGALRPFAIRYCAGHEEIISKSKKVFKFDGASHLEELQEKLRSTCLIRRLKIDVLKDLPPKRRQIIPLPPSEEAKKLIARELEEWEKKFGSDLALVEAAIDIAEENQDPQAYSTAVDRLQYIQRVAFIEMARVRREIAVVKIPEVIEHLEGMFEEGVQKIICFAHHKEVIHTLIKKFGDIAVSIYGEIKQDDRQIAVDRFQNDDKIKLFIGGITAAGVGITLTAASNVVFAELDWTPGNVNQAEDRAHRIGQTNSVLVQHLVLDGSLDARMAQMVVEKQEIADRALDRSTDIAVRGVVNARPEAPVEPIPLWKKVALKEAMLLLAKRRDKETVGGHGFSQFDVPIGHSLALSQRPFSDKQAHLAMRLARKYRRQLSLSNEKLAKQLDIYEIETPRSSKKKKDDEQEVSLLDRILSSSS